MVNARRLLVLSALCSFLLAALCGLNATGTPYRSIGEIGAAAVFGADPNTRNYGPISCAVANLNQNPGAVTQCGGVANGTTCIFCSVVVAAPDVQTGQSPQGYTISTAISCGDLSIGQCMAGVCQNTQFEPGGCSTYLEIWATQPM